MKTPMSSSIKLDKDEKGKSIYSTMYRGMIGERLLPLSKRPIELSQPTQTETHRNTSETNSRGISDDDAHDISIYDTYDEQSLGRMKFEKAPDGPWIRRAERSPAQARGQGQPELDIPPFQSKGVQFEATFSEPMISESTYTVGSSSHPSFTKPSHTETSLHQAPHAPDHAPWMDLSTQISSLALAWRSL
ncbi:hypothetical protein CK203_075500 [Vitis vinifera]|uniref:Uncharacterized protein n=1 Tax=Vitis vinifera TaxID=29760 RepID=A0A438EUG1_VITVI|nr:hypothetical protein CK203_075500 [Vitis vinifera]